MADPGLIALVAVLLGLSVCLLTVVNTDAAVVLLIASMLLSPEIALAQLPERSIVVRFDDLLLGVVFVTWLGKLAINKQLGLLRSTPVNGAILLFIALAAISTSLGILNNTVTNPKACFFYFAKYVQYFVLFFMTANVIRDRAQVERFLKALCITAMIVSLHAYWQMVHHGIGFRVTAPFEGKPEPNTLAGYLVIMMALVMSLALHARSGIRRLSLLGLFLLMLPPLVFTYSRGGYAAFFASYLALAFLSKKHRPLLWCLLLVGLLIAPAALPETVWQRLQDTFDPHGQVTVGQLRLADSPAHRILIWRIIFERWKEHPLLGFGVTGVGFVDNQNALVLGEMGLLGLMSYLWVRWRLLQISLLSYRTVEDSLVQAVNLGFFAGLIGLLVHSFTGNIFIIVRIMEPFWFLAGIVMVLPRIALPVGAAHPTSHETAARAWKPAPAIGAG